MHRQAELEFDDSTYTLIDEDAWMVPRHMRDLMGKNGSLNMPKEDVRDEIMYYFLAPIREHKAAAYLDG